MNLPIEFWIIASVLIGTLIGWISCSVIASSRLRRIERKTWAAARLYYTRRAASHFIR